MSFNSISPSYILFKLQIADYLNYIDLMEDTIKSHKSNIIKVFEESSANITNPEDKQEYFEIQYLDDYQNLDKTYTYILRKSIFITLYSFMESELLKIAKRLEGKEDSKIKLQDISHRGIRQYLFYIENVNQIKLDISTKDRKRFIKYNSLRNYFVHNEGVRISSEKYNEFRSLPHINFINLTVGQNTTYNVAGIEKNFNKTYLNLISKVFEQLFKVLNNHKH